MPKALERFGLAVDAAAGGWGSILDAVYDGIFEELRSVEQTSRPNDSRGMRRTRIPQWAEVPHHLPSVGKRGNPSSSRKALC